jgi:hypothetical protein
MSEKDNIKEEELVFPELGDTGHPREGDLIIAVRDDQTMIIGDTAVGMKGISSRRRVT